MIVRTSDMSRIRQALSRSRVVAILGPRQSGKTTLARQIVSHSSPNYFDLEDHRDVLRLQNPAEALESLKGTVVIDEVQRSPELFPFLRVLADRRPLPAKFLILGSASPDLLRQSSESLAGRIEIVPLDGLRLLDLGPSTADRLWLRGAFPRSYTARTNNESYEWRRQFITMFVERDAPLLGIDVPPVLLQRFWSMLAHYHAQTFNSSEIARSLSLSDQTVRRYLDLLTSAFMVRQLQPWFENLGKRQVKAPKVFIRDSGLLHTLLGIPTRIDLERHPKLGASWEGFAVEEVIKSVAPDQAYFWATHQGAELDLLLFKNGKRIGVECKRADAPIMTPSMRISLHDLKLDYLYVIYPGDLRYRLSDNVEVIPVAELADAKFSLLPPRPSRRRRAI